MRREVLLTALQNEVFFATIVATTWWSVDRMKGIKIKRFFIPQSGTYMMPSGHLSVTSEWTETVRGLKPSHP